MAPDFHRTYHCSITKGAPGIGGILAHASICFMAPVLHRVIRQHLRLAGSALSPEAALQQLRRVHRHRVRIDGAEPIASIFTIDQVQDQDQDDTQDALKIKKPSLNAQMSLR